MRRKSGDLSDRERPVSDMLEQYTEKGLSPWHMPGHKRKAVLGGYWDPVFKRDLTEVSGTDDYHHPEGVILRSQQQAAEIYGVRYSHYLVGGATAGILAGVLALTEFRKDRGKERDEAVDTDSPVFLVAGNVHRSVQNALRLVEGEGILLAPEKDPYYGPVLPETVEAQLNRLKESGKLSGVAGCIITSPTYSGTISPLAEIHALLEKEGIPLLVDEAHGAHLPFCKALQEYSGIHAGAELVVQSLHKTLPALTQTAIIHVNQPVKEGAGERMDQLNRILKDKLSVVQSSSPSYILLASAEGAVVWSDEHRTEFDAFLLRLRVFRDRLREKLNHLELVDHSPVQDPSRIFLKAPAGLGEWLQRETGVVPELSGSRELILISTVMDTEEDLQHLYEALLMADRFVGESEEQPVGQPAGQSVEQAEEQPVDHADPDTPLPSPGEPVPEDIYVYPPGVLILKKGDRMTEEARDRIREEQAAGRKVYGCSS